MQLPEQHYSNQCYLSEFDNPQYQYGFNEQAQSNIQSQQNQGQKNLISLQPIPLQESTKKAQQNNNGDKQINLQEQKDISQQQNEAQVQQQNIQGQQNQNGEQQRKISLNLRRTSENVDENGRLSQKLQKPRLYMYRWVILVLYLLGDLAPSLIVTTTTPIANQISQIYTLLPIEVNLSSLVILLATPIATVFSSKFLDQKGLNVSIRIGTIICVCGAWLRILVNQSFYFVVAGNLLTGLGSPFIFNGKTQVASNWFSHEQGPGVTSFITFWANLNAIVGFVFAGNFLGDYQFDITTEQHGRNLVWKLMISIAFAVSGIALLVWIFFKQNPPTPPSYSAQILREQNFKESIKKLIRNRNYIFLVLQQGLLLGSISGLATSISYFIHPFGFDSADSTLMLGAIPIGGIFGTVVGSYFLNKYKQYKYQMGIYIMGGSGGLFFLLLMLYTRNIYLVVLATGILGLFFIPLIPTILEFACECVFPIGEGSAVGFLSGVSSVFALIYGSVMSFIVKGETQTQTFVGTIVMLSSFGLGFLLLFLTKEQLMRLQMERMSSTQFESGNEIQLADFNFGNNEDNIISLQQIQSTQMMSTDIESPQIKENQSQVVLVKNKSENLAEPESVFSSTNSTDYSTSDSQFKSQDQPKQEISEKNFLSTDSEVQSSATTMQDLSSNDSPIHTKSITDTDKIKMMMHKVYSADQSNKQMKDNQHQKQKKKSSSPSSRSESSQSDEEYECNSAQLNSANDVDVIKSQLMNESEMVNVENIQEQTNRNQHQDDSDGSPSYVRKC